MPNNINKSLVLIGVGKMGKAYASVLKDLNVDFIAIGRGKDRVKEFQELYPSINTLSGGVDKYLEENTPPEIAIVAIPISNLVEVAVQLIKKGVKKILLEKPGALEEEPLQKLSKIANEYYSQVFIAYNRRFFSSINKVEEIIKFDEGLNSIHFNFTEMTKKIKLKKHGDKTLKKWVIANSSHVIDTAFMLAGFPKKLNVLIDGNEVNWHPSGSIFIGNGTTKKNIPFSYFADWGSAGRWSIEFFTKKRRLILCPIEQVQEQLFGETNISNVEIDDSLDEQYKPGIYKLCNAFVFNENQEKLLSIAEQIQHLKTYNTIGGYE